MSKKIIGFFIVSVFAIAAFAGVSDYPRLDIRDDESLMLIPSYCYFDKKSNTYHIKFHAWVYEPEISSKKRKVLVSAVSKILDIDEDSLGKTLFDKRAMFMLYDNEKSKWIGVGYGGDIYNLGITDSTGHTEREIVLPPEIFIKGLPEDVKLDEFKQKPSLVSYRAGTRHNSERIFEGKARYIPPDGMMVVSDIDDTIKITEVNDKKKLLENTFLKPYTPVNGMSDLYTLWEDGGAAFVYLTASPWQLYEPLTEFLSTEGFPEGVMEMKIFDLGSGINSMFSGPEKMKLSSLRKMIKSFPGRKFVLVGDSGEKDPEIYGKVASEFRDRVAWIFIRNVSGETLESKRINEALKGFPLERFRLFSDPEELMSINIRNY